MGEESYKGKLLFLMREFFPFGTYIQSMFYIQNIFLKDKIYGFRVPQFQLAYIRNMTNPLQFF